MILITGGLGYIGAHICVELLNNNYKILILDNLINSNITKLKEIEKITNRDNINFICLNLLNKKELTNLFKVYKINTVIHTAGYKSVADSIDNPLDYYNNNIIGFINLLTCMKENNVKNIILSSSATVYGTQVYPVSEESPTGIGITSPYGRTKFIQEEIIKDLYKSDNSWQIVIFRYFNPVSNHQTGLLKEKSKHITNLFPLIYQTSIGEKEYLDIYGDGSIKRDFIHIVDIARAHILPLTKILNPGLYIYNLGTGHPTSVNELIKSFNNTNKVIVSCKYKDNRPGDLLCIYANVDKIKQELGWVAEYSIEDMCRDVYIQ